MKKLIFIIVVLAIAIFSFTTLKMNVNDSEFLSDYLIDIENYMDLREEINTDVSKVDVAWHLDHSLKTINQIYLSMSASDPDKFDSSFSFLRTISLSFNFIPRGFAQSPASVLPPEIILEADLIRQLQSARDNAEKIMLLDRNSHFDHPYFGQLKRSHTMRFLQVHTHHHLKIINDILKK